MSNSLVLCSTGWQFFFLHIIFQTHSSSPQNFWAFDPHYITNPFQLDLVYDKTIRVPRCPWRVPRCPWWCPWRWLWYVPAVPARRPVPSVPEPRHPGPVPSSSPPAVMASTAARGSPTTRGSPATRSYSCGSPTACGSSTARCPCWHCWQWERVCGAWGNPYCPCCRRRYKYTNIL